MKKSLITLLAAIALIPAAALAKSDKIVTYETTDINAPAPTTVGVPGYMDKITSTVTRTVTKNSRSDTEFHANDPNAGETKTDVQVSERVLYR